MPSGKLSKKDATQVKMREILSDAYSFVLGQEYTKTAATVSVEQLMDEGIHRLTGTTSRKSDRPSRLDRIKSIKSQITAAVKEAKAKELSDWVFEGAPTEESEKANTAASSTTTGT